MKRGTPDHPKTAALMRILGMSKREAVGTLELLWHFTGRFAPQGDIGRYKDVEIASAVDWPGKPALLIAGLVRTKFLVRHSAYRLVVHDWHDHADEAVKKYLSRASKPFLTKDIPNEPVSTPSGHVQTYMPGRVETPSARVETAVAVARAFTMADAVAPARAEPEPVPLPLRPEDTSRREPPEPDHGPSLPDTDTASQRGAQRVAYVQGVMRALADKRGQHSTLVATPADEELASRWFAEGIPVRTVRAGIEAFMGTPWSLEAVAASVRAAAARRSRAIGPAQTGGTDVGNRGG